jgi:hypothetical protein
MVSPGRRSATKPSDRKNSKSNSTLSGNEARPDVKMGRKEETEELQLAKEI